jgi:hypothetical protein
MKRNFRVLNTSFVASRIPLVACSNVYVSK